MHWSLKLMNWSLHWAVHWSLNSWNDHCIIIDQCIGQWMTEFITTLITELITDILNWSGDCAHLTVRATCQLILTAFSNWAQLKCNTRFNSIQYSLDVVDLQWSSSQEWLQFTCSLHTNDRLIQVLSPHGNCQSSSHGPEIEIIKNCVSYFYFSCRKCNSNLKCVELVH